jgi:hypothetical protein
VESEHVVFLLNQLDSEVFDVRDAAQRELEARCDACADLLERTLTRQISIETRRRVSAILQERARQMDLFEMRWKIQAIRVLGMMQCDESLALLRELAGGAACSIITRESFDALRQWRSLANLVEHTNENGHSGLKGEAVIGWNYPRMSPIPPVYLMERGVLSNHGGF